MKERSNRLRAWIYSQNLRDFINHEIKVVITKSDYIFKSKLQDYTFRIISREEIPFLAFDVISYSIVTDIFDQICEKRNNDSIQ